MNDSTHHHHLPDHGALSADRDLLRSQAQDWLVRLTSGSATTDDAQAYKRWCAQSAAHAAAMAEANRLWALSRQAGQAFAGRRTVATASAPVRRSGGRRAFLGGALAAGVAGWMVLRPPGKLWPAWSEITADYHTGTGEQRDLSLGREVQVALNTQTAVNLLPGQSGIELSSGEAQVEAPGGAGFVVRAGGGEVSASSATRYNVRVDGDQVCVTCLAGTVEVSYGGTRLQAAAAQQIAYGGGQAARSAAADAGRLGAWRRGVLVFDDVPLAKVVEEINRYRPGRLIVTNPELGRRRVQALVRLNQLADVVGMIQAGYGAQVTTLPAGIVVLS